MHLTSPVATRPQWMFYELQYDAGRPKPRHSLPTRRGAGCPSATDTRSTERLRIVPMPHRTNSPRGCAPKPIRRRGSFPPESDLPRAEIARRVLGSVRSNCAWTKRLALPDALLERERAVEHVRAAMRAMGRR